jgi:hypothetical protein
VNSEKKVSAQIQSCQEHPTAETYAPNPIDETCEEENTILMTKHSDILRQFLLALGIAFGLSSTAIAHSGIVDGYGCHRGPDKVSYHCHQGQFAGRTFKSKEDFLRELRGGKSEQLSPKNNRPAPEKKFKDPYS